MAFRMRLDGVAIPVTLMLGALVILALILPLPGLIATKALVLIFAISLLWVTIWRMRRTDRAIARFFDAISHADLSQRFGGVGAANGLGELGDAMDRVLGRLLEERITASTETHFAAALIDEVPSALLVIDPDSVVYLVNKAARRLFPGGHGRAIVEFARYGGAFELALGEAMPGTRGTARLLVDGLLQRSVITCAAVEREGWVVRAVSVQIIQRELDAAELATQVDLVRVLTHEIMNSLTPVTSLAASAAELIAAVELGNTAALTDARIAIDTLARRAEGIHNFVDGYRAFSETPSVTKTRFAVRPWLLEIVRSFKASEYGHATAVDWDVAPVTLAMDGDADLLGQVLLNLMKNGAEAARDYSTSPSVRVAVTLHRSSRIRIVVSDDGPGIAPSRKSDIFLPFFTTKPRGMGVGLSFARQIVLLHGGAIGIVETTGGASFEMIL
jgi:two-component system nitrogen regulation sensor histidine kinase NtrY